MVGLIAVFAFSVIENDNAKKKSIDTPVALGEKLFFDPILSADLSISCASCHKPEFAFADTSAFSKGVGGLLGNRNTPSVMNMAMREQLFWDGRAADLEAQVVFPIENPVEMNLPINEAVKRIRNSDEYRILFKKIYNSLPTKKLLINAISSYEKTLETENTPNDRWLNDEKNHGMTAAQLRGREIFIGTKAKCFDCHFTPDFTNDEFRNIGTFDGEKLNDSGRYLFTKNKNDIGKFKVPGLRNVAVTAPYMHDGSFKNLRNVIDYYDDISKFVPNAKFIDTILPQKIGLTEMEKQDLEAFLESLTDDRFSYLLKKN